MIVMFARENEGRVGEYRAFVAERRRVLSLRSVCATRLPRAMLEIEINSNLPGVHVRIAAVN